MISREGARLQELMNKAERARDPATTLFIFGMPYLWVRKAKMTKDKVRSLEETIARVKGNC